ncbi:MAG: alpha/beta fold hydrolase [Acidobacteriota bacterium]|nr:MAG: alpha/beta fold hydrolase [Acidobacteriota bacterium]
MSLSFREYGSGYPVVMLHAFPLDGRMWESNAWALAEEGYRVIVPDLTGFGRSEEGPTTVGMEYMAREVSETVATLGIPKAVFCGLSMGGYVLFRLYDIFPLSFKALILCDTSASADSDEKRAARDQMIETVETEGSSVLVDSLLPKLVSGETLKNNGELMSRLGAIVREQSSDAICSALRGMAARPDSVPYLKDVSVPTLLVFGEEDSVTGLDAANELVEGIPDALLETIEGAGHYSNLEAPSEFDRHLITFLKSLDLSN